MKLEKITIKNFRCYHQEISANFSDLTAFVGKNDIGKSTILEALEIFFNNETVKIDQSDKHIHSDDSTVTITCEFSDLPQTLSLDAGADTDLKSEFLLSSSGNLKIMKIFDCGNKKVPQEIFIVANHPSAPGSDDLLELKEKDLQNRIKLNGIKVSLKGNPGMRKALWAVEKDLALQERQLSMSRAKEDGKRIWEELERHLPLYALFQSDRKSQDSDGEVQNPMKAAITAALAEVQEEIDAIQLKVREKAEAIAAETHTALVSLDKELAKELKPEFTPPTNAKWNGLFSINMSTDGVPLNKRGSGVRRLVLVSFFKAEAERKLKTTSKRQVIYAIEEPETSQHPNNQRVLLDALKSISNEPNCQVIITTHSPGLASELPVESIRFINRDDDKVLSIQDGIPAFGLIAQTLGVVPDSRVKALFYVEGPTDVEAFKSLSRALHQSDTSIPDLSSDERVAFVVMGGSTLVQWVSQHYLKGIGRKEFHIYDRDVPSYEVAVATVNGRNDGSQARQTKKHEIECYLHSAAIEAAFGVTIPIDDHPTTRADSVATLFGKAYAAAKGWDAPMGENKSKQYLARRAFPLMTAAWIDERDPNGEVREWFSHLAALLNN